MSIRAIHWVLSDRGARGFDRLVMIALADEADDEGLKCYPSMRTIADKACMSLGAVREAIDQLEADGELVVWRPEKTGRGNHNFYAMVMGRDVKTVAKMLDEWMGRHARQAIGSIAVLEGSDLRGRVSRKRSSGARFPEGPSEDTEEEERALGRAFPEDEGAPGRAIIQPESEPSNDVITRADCPETRALGRADPVIQTQREEEPSVLPFATSPEKNVHGEPTPFDGEVSPVGDEAEQAEQDPKDDPLYRFEEFWNRYPARGGRKIGKADATKAWAKLSKTEKARAWSNLRRFQQYLDTSDLSPMDALRWLNPSKAGGYTDYDSEAEATPKRRPAPARRSAGTVDDVKAEIGNEIGERIERFSAAAARSLDNQQPALAAGSTSDDQRTLS